MLSTNESKGKFLYSTVSSPQDCSQRFRPFNQTPSQLLCETSGHSTINARSLLVQISTLVYSQVIQLSELDQCKLQNLHKIQHSSTRFESEYS